MCLLSQHQYIILPAVCLLSQLQYIILPAVCLLSQLQYILLPAVCLLSQLQYILLPAVCLLSQLQLVHYSPHCVLCVAICIYRSIYNLFKKQTYQFLSTLTHIRPVYPSYAYEGHPVILHIHYNKCFPTKQIDPVQSRSPHGCFPLVRSSLGGRSSRFRSAASSLPWSAWSAPWGRGSWRRGSCQG